MSYEVRKVFFVIIHYDGYAFINLSRKNVDPLIDAIKNIIII